MMDPLRIAKFAAMAAPVLPGKAPPFLRRAELLDHPPAVDLLDDVAALGHRERLRQRTLVVELGAAGMLERLEPGWVDEVRHLDAVDEEGVLLHGVADLIGI